jgi:hypothetical protein
MIQRTQKKTFRCLLAVAWGAFSPLFPSEVGLGTGGTEVPPSFPPSFL